jgi:hypothetical protein
MRTKTFPFAPKRGNDATRLVTGKLRNAREIYSPSYDLVRDLEADGERPTDAAPSSVPMMPSPLRSALDVRRVGVSGRKRAQ